MSQPVGALLAGLSPLSEGPPDAPVVSVQASLWEALEHLQGHPSPLLGIRSSNGVQYVPRQACWRQYRCRTVVRGIGKESMLFPIENVCVNVTFSDGKRKRSLPDLTF
jgi:hypothetical protein